VTAVELAADRARLLGVLADLFASGCRVPCVDSSDPTPWTADDPAEQELAARMCVGCAGFADCRTFIRRWPKESGVYGATTEADRRPRPGRRPATTSPTTRGTTR